MKSTLWKNACRAVLVGGVGLCASSVSAQIQISVDDGRAADPSRPVPETYQVRQGDTLWDITGRFYGDHYAWPRVWSYNPEITNPHWIYPNSTIRLRGAGGDAPVASNAGSGIGVAKGRVRGSEASVYLGDFGFADRQALDEAGRIIGSVEEHMLLSVGDEVYVRFKDKPPVGPGKELTIFREVEEEERIESEEGELVRILGSVKVLDYDTDKDLGHGVITEALDPIERGFQIATVPRGFKAVEPTPSKADVGGKIIAVLRPRTLLAAEQLVFVNRGHKEGLATGNRIFFVHKGDRWRQELRSGEEEYGAQEPGVGSDADLPKEIVAEGRVVHTRPETSTVFIVRSQYDLSIGQPFRTIKGK